MTHSLLRHGLTLAATLALAACGTSPTAPTSLPAPGTPAPPFTVFMTSGNAVTTLPATALAGTLHRSPDASGPSIGTIRIDTTPAGDFGQSRVRMLVTLPTGTLTVDTTGTARRDPFGDAVLVTFPGTGPTCASAALDPNGLLRDGTVTVSIQRTSSADSWTGQVTTMQCPDGAGGRVVAESLTTRLTATTAG